MPIFIDANAVAEEIGFNSGAHFLMNRARLEREEEFPTPMPTCKRPLKWRGSEVKAWVERQGTAADQAFGTPKTTSPTGTSRMLQEAARP
ncbi:hypothetical protein [Shimia sp.]|uniref:hypothetical protein n=1 Tax=Shimia sp. TaxID=1954381 RepID=UPI003BA9AD21